MSRNCICLLTAVLLAGCGGSQGPTQPATPGSATQLAFTGQPSNTVAGAVITPAVQVTARDASGNTATAFTGTVTVAIGANGGGGSLSGTTTMAAVNGVATFPMLSINKSGTGYTLVASATTLTTATSAAFNIAFVVTIDETAGLVSFPNKYSGWTVGGSALTNWLAVPGGWTVGGSAGTNWVAVPPGWTVGGSALTNWVALPPGWTAGGSAGTNWVALPPGWTVGGSAGTNWVAVPPGWTVGGSALTNWVELAPGWTAGGSALTNWVALPPGWTVGGSALTNWVAIAPGWAVGGSAGTNWIAYHGSQVTTIQLRFNDAGFLALFKVLQASAQYTDDKLADIIMAVWVNDESQRNHLTRPAGEW